MTKIQRTGVLGAVVLMLMALFAMPASATTCSDGQVTGSTGSGTCSWHGGIYRVPNLIPDPAGYVQMPSPQQVADDLLPYTHNYIANWMCSSAENSTCFVRTTWVKAYTLNVSTPGLWKITTSCVSPLNGWLRDANGAYILDSRGMPMRNCFVWQSTLKPW